MQSLFTFAGTASTILTLAKLGGAKVNLDGRSADFLKIQVGKTRYDILGGFQQYFRLASQLMTGERVSSTTGVVTEVGEGFKPLTRMDMLTGFAESKEAPTLSFLTGLLRGQTPFGREFEPVKELGLRVTPMLIQDMYDLQQDKGYRALGMGIPAIFGVGMQTYNMEPSDVVRSSRAVTRYSKSLLKQGRRVEAIGIMERNKDVRKLGVKLSGLHDVLQEKEKLRDDTRKNVRLSKKQKSDRILSLDQDIQKLQDEMKRISQQERLPSVIPRSPQ